MYKNELTLIPRNDREFLIDIRDSLSHHFDHHEWVRFSRIICKYEDLYIYHEDTKNKTWITKLDAFMLRLAYITIPAIAILTFLVVLRK